MTRARGWRLLTAAVGVAFLTLTGCGDDGPTDDPEEPEYDGPLAEFMGWENTGLGEEQEFTEEERQQHYEIQDLIVACMSEAGFEYTPEPFYGDREEEFQDPNEEVWRLQEEDPEAFAREYGYGFTTVDYDLEGIETADPNGDPNGAYRESLSPAAQEEYDKALWGDWEAYEEELEEAGEEGEVEEPEPGGCSDEAYKEVYGDPDEGDESQFEELFKEFDSLYQRIENDPRMEFATQAWIECMTVAGYPDLEDLHSGQNEVSERQSELYGWDDEGVLPEPIEEGDGEATEETPTPIETVEPDPAELEELRQFERDIAVADYTCRQEHDIDDVERDVRYEHEEQFIEDNREQLEAYRDWSNEQGVRG
jgi:hypothetical protein